MSAEPACNKNGSLPVAVLSTFYFEQSGLSTFVFRLSTFDFEQSGLSTFVFLL